MGGLASAGAGLLGKIAAQLSGVQWDPAAVDVLQRRAAELAQRQSAMRGGASSSEPAPVDPAGKILGMRPPMISAPEDPVRSADVAGLGAPGERWIQAAPVPGAAVVHPAAAKMLGLSRNAERGFVPGVPGGVAMEDLGGRPGPPAPVEFGVELPSLPIIGHSPEEIASYQPATGAAPGPDLTPGSLPRPDPRAILQQYGIGSFVPPSAPQVQPAQGWLHKLGQHLLGGVEGLGAGMATGHPLGGAIMGVAGGVNPQLGANAWYNNVTLPRWEQQQAAGLDLAGKRMGVLNQIAAITGINPVTGEPTAAQQREEALESYRDLVNGLKASHDQLDREVKEGRLTQGQATLELRRRIEHFNEQIKMLQAGIAQQNADANTQRASIAGQPRTTTTRRTWSPNPDHARWENDHAEWETRRDEVIKKHPDKSVSQLIQSRLLSKEPKEPPAQIQTGSTTTSGRVSPKTQGTPRGPEATLPPEERQRRYEATVQTIQGRTDLTAEQKAAMIARQKAKYGIQ